MSITPALFWLLAGLPLLALAMVGLDGDGLLLMAGLAALAVALLTAASGALTTTLQGLLFGALLAFGYGWLRHWDRRQGERPLPPSSRAESAEVISAFGNDGRGRVRWQGQSWAATNLEPGVPLLPGHAVTVMGREGTRLQVLPDRPL
jgi:membrane protein implicated in regulation of membrane protease activity